MSRRRIVFAAVVLAVVLAAVVVGTASRSPGPGPASSPPAGAPTVDGVVVHITSGGLSKVTEFTLRARDGRLLTFDLASLQDPVRFPPGHLGEHLANSVPIRVWYRDDGGGRLSALWLEDAPTG